MIQTSYIAPGAVLARIVPDYALMVDEPVRQKRWMSRRHRHLLKDADAQGIMT